MTRAEVLALAALLGARVSQRRSGRVWLVEVEAPAGQRWADGGVHTLTAWSYHPGVDWADLGARMRAGLRPCEEQEGGG